MSEYPKGDDNFNERLELSESAVDQVARWLQSSNRYVFKALKTDGPDNGDLISIHNCKMHLIDVKHKDVVFTSREDFPYDDIWICQTHQYDDKCPRPDVFVLLNKARTHAAIVKACNYEKWSKRMAPHPNNKSGKSLSYFTNLFDVVGVPRETSNS